MGNCLRRHISAFNGNEKNQDNIKLCKAHKIQLTYVCVDSNCQNKGVELCRKCIGLKHRNHNVEEIEQYEEQFNQNCSMISNLQNTLCHIKNYSNMLTTQRDLMKPLIERKKHTNIHNLSDRMPKIEESIRLKLQHTAYQIQLEQDKQLTKMEDELINSIENLSVISNNPERQQLIANFQFNSFSYNELISYHIYQSSKQINQMAQKMNPYKFDYQSFKNVNKSNLVIQKDIKYMKLKNHCRMDSRFTAIHYRDHRNVSEFYIIDFIDENIIYKFKQQPEQVDGLDYLSKITYLGNYYICFNFITYILIKDFSYLIKTYSKQYHKSGFDMIKWLTNDSMYFQGQYSQEQIEKSIKTIKIATNKLIFTVDKIKSGQLCLIEQSHDFFIQARDYSIWNFKKKQCVRTLNIMGDYVYDIFRNYIVLERNFTSFTLFNWKTNQIEKQYLNLFEYLTKFNQKFDSEQQYDIEAVKIFAIQKILTTKDDTFLNSQPSFEDWLKSLPFQYKQMIIYEDNWLFRYDYTSIIMLQDCLLIYDMNLNKIVTQFKLQIPSEQISFIWQVKNKLIYLTKEGQLKFYK